MGLLQLGNADCVFCRQGKGGMARERQCVGLLGLLGKEGMLLLCILVGHGMTDALQF